MKERQILVHQLPTHVVEVGEGPELVFLHGWGSESQTFYALAEQLSTQQYRCILIDLPGFGKTAAPEEAWGVAEYAAFVGAVLEKLGLTNVKAIIGHSLGGRIALKGLASNVLHSERLVLLASAGVAKRDTIRNQAFKVVAKAGKFICRVPPFSLAAKPLRTWLYKAAGSTDYLNSGSLRQTFALVVDEDLSNYAQQVPVPTLLIWGEQDTETPPQEGERLQVLLPEGRLLTIPQAGHYVHRDAEAAVVQEIVTFLAS